MCPTCQSPAAAWVRDGRCLKCVRAGIQHPGRVRCAHCDQRAATRPRGLCTRCYDDRDIRDRFPIEASKYTARGEPTWEELERIETEQRALIPTLDWWNRESERMQGAHVITDEE